MPHRRQSRLGRVATVRTGVRLSSQFDGGVKGTLSSLARFECGRRYAQAIRTGSSKDKVRMKSLIAFMVAVCVTLSSAGMGTVVLVKRSRFARNLGLREVHNRPVIIASWKSNFPRRRWKQRRVWIFGAHGAASETRCSGDPEIIRRASKTIRVIRTRLLPTTNKCLGSEASNENEHNCCRKCRRLFGFNRWASGGRRRCQSDRAVSDRQFRKIGNGDVRRKCRYDGWRQYHLYIAVEAICAFCANWLPTSNRKRRLKYQATDVCCEAHGNSQNLACVAIGLNGYSYAQAHI